MALANTIWPPGLDAPRCLKEWLAELYKTVDSKAADSGERLASLYAHDGVMYGLAGKATGSEEIAASRKNAWKAISSRKHEILQVFAGNADFSSILLVGRLIAEMQNGIVVDTEFIAQIELEGLEAEKPRGKLYKVWGDSAPWAKAMKAELK